MNKGVPPVALPESDRVEVVPGGLLIGPELVPIWAASVDYFSLPREKWPDVLAATRALGFRQIEVRVPWALHDTDDEVFDFGAGKENLDVVAFLLEAARFGLFVIVHLGPRQESSVDLRDAGVPRHLLWDSDVHALTARGNPLIIPELLGSSPEPSWFSEKYERECLRWLRAAAGCMARMAYPSGPIVMVELGSQHDARLVQRTYGDFREEALRSYRDHLKNKYERVAALRGAHGGDIEDFATVLPPSDATQLVEAPAALTLDWLDFQAQRRAATYREFRLAVNQAGFESAVLVLPRDAAERLAGRETTFSREHLSGRLTARPVDAFALGSVGAGVGTRFAAEAALFRFKGGFAFDCLPVSEQEQAFQTLWALAHGVHGFTVSPALERSRFLGGLLDRAAGPKPAAEFWSILLQAAERCQIHRLEVESPVRIVLPARLRLLAAAQQGLKPADPSWLGLSALPVTPTAEPTSTESSELAEVSRFFRDLNDALRDQRVSYSLVSDASFDSGLNGSEWTIVLCGGELAPELVEGIRFAVSRGDAVSIGPSLPDGFVLEADSRRTPPILLPRSVDSLRQCCAAVQKVRGFLSHQVAPQELEVLIHRTADAKSTPSVLFAINPTQKGLVAEVACTGFDARDALNREVIRSFAERLEFAVPARTVRMLELRPTL